MPQSSSNAIIATDEVGKLSSKRDDASTEMAALKSVMAQITIIACCLFCFSLGIRPLAKDTKKIYEIKPSQMVTKCND